MSRSCCIVVSVLLALAVTASATVLPHEERKEDKQTVQGDGHLLDEAMRLLVNKASSGEPYMEAKPSGGVVATMGDDQSSSGGSSGGEHSKEGEGSNKEGEKHAKNCLTKEACHKKKIICGKGCTLSAHSKCAAKCSKSCVPTC
ncbi:hypothetical protein QOZ80_4AG0299370 [Eleusine coracana subsp. coracana]|nr:hypothetical protein QOZ80_4AG0299370 [Eleusine coracana subsp. coracana]